MKRLPGFSLLPLCLLLWSCSETPNSVEERAAEPAWSDEQEVIHQLREVIRYEDESEQQRLEDLKDLALPVDPVAPAEPVVPAGEGQDKTQH